jgi:hypothetical protein
MTSTFDYTPNIVSSTSQGVVDVPFSNRNKPHDQWQILKNIWESILHMDLKGKYQKW